MKPCASWVTTRSSMRNTSILRTSLVSHKCFHLTVSRLTALGRDQAAQAREAMSHTSEEVQLLVVSPLKRTLQTLNEVFPNSTLPKVIVYRARPTLFLFEFSIVLSLLESK